MPDPYRDFPDLTFDRPAPGVLRITLDAPGLNAVNHAVHRQLADVWRAVDRDADTNVALLQGAGKGFSAGGSFDLIERIVNDDEVRAEVMREARDLVFNVIDCSKPIVSAIHGPAVGAGLVVGILADVWSPAPRASSMATRGSASLPATTRRSAGRSCAGWPRRSTTC
jgi:enoyl-CoA hydratase